MRLLVLGGTQFLSRAVAADAVARGHDVTCGCRGVTGAVPEGAEHVVFDRAAGPVPADLAATAYDAVVDVTDQPGWVRHAVGAFPDAHWVFVSTINVYDDETTPGGTPDTLRLREPVAEDGQGRESPEAYGGRKVTCERLVREGVASSTVIRPGLIVGPEDPTGRFSYWPARLADGGEVLAPGTPDDDVQVVDVRDLATWIVDCAESRTDRGVRRDQSRADPRRVPGPGGHRSGRRAHVHLGRPGLPGRAEGRALDGARGRSRSGCRCPTTPA